MLHDLLIDGAAARPVPIHPVTRDTLAGVLQRLPEPQVRFAEAQGFEAGAQRHLVLPGRGGTVGAVLAGVDEADPFSLGRLSALLPPGDYALKGRLRRPDLAVLGWLLAAYRFTRYRKPSDARAARLVLPRGVDGVAVGRIAAAVSAGRDLINTPASDCGPDEIEAAVRTLAAAHGASVHVTLGDALIGAGFPMIHAVGRASTRAPRLIDMSWGAADAPKVTLVGKGVAFDTGGLNIKPDASMLLMKKDMGGAASALTAARLIMDSGLPVRLRLLIPAVENAIAGNAFRPGDVLASRKGMSVEIGNTDAEGRLILADALALADEEAPDLLIDLATLTGAARVALGPDLPPLYTRDEALAAEMQALGFSEHDPVWRLPLWKPYDSLMSSKIADVNHISSGPFAGSITAALFLARFVEKARAYAHLDIFGWTPAAKPGRPEGGEPQGARLVHALVRARYGGR